jgi:hypothetical protein
MSLTNAEHHVLAYRGAGWRYAGFRRRCDRYFGQIGTCTGEIRPGDPVFDTTVKRPGGAADRHRATFTVCEACARAPHRAEFPAEAAA